MLHIAVTKEQLSDSFLALIGIRQLFKGYGSTQIRD